MAVAVTQVAEPVAAAPTSAPLRLEWVWGKERQTVELTDRAVMIGSAPTADLRIKASFLLAEHAIIEPDGAGAWQVRVLAPGASVVRQGVVAAQAPLLPGDVLRLTDRIGNFITLRALGEVLRVRDQALRSLLPQPGESYLIGSDPSCATRLDHPLVHRRHAALRRDGAGTLWVEDRGTSAGTYVNGHRLRGKQRLALSDIVQIGPFTATVGPHALEPLAQVSGVDIQVQRATVTAGPKTLLHGVDLHLPPATLTAIVGPSGAGKTTLMRLLSGQSAASSGQVTYNGVPIAECREGYAELTGFVPQDDLVHADLTVDEGLLYQARLRLGASTSEEERRARVDKLVGMLGLATQRGQLVKTLSGGQRKRVCIACELLKEPELLFLDEPTSGLDPGLDKRMMLLLRLLADQGRTVLLTTHSIAHVDVCDTLVLVGPGGYVIYAGPPSAAAEMFGVDTLGEVFAIIDSPEAALEASLRRTPTAAPAPVMPRRVAPTPSASGAGPAFGSAAWWRSLGPEMRIFTSRHLRLIVRDRSATAFTLLQGIVVALLTAAVAPSPLIWKDNSNSMMFVLGCAAVWFGMITSVRELVKERGIWRREFAAGANLYAYLASKLVVLGGLAVVQSLSMTVALGAVVGLPPDAPFGGAFIPIVISLTAANMAGVTMGLLVSATSRTADRALSLVPYLLVGQLILCGVLFRLGSLTFVSWLTPARWAVSSLGGIAGLDAKALHQAGGLYPHSAAGLFANWVVLVLTSLAAVAATCFAMQRQGRAWNAGLEMPEPLWRTMTTGSGSRV